MNPVGFMQGRLTPRPADRIQAFPKDNWREEFRLGKKIGFDSLEFIHDKLHEEANPLFTPAGRAEINSLVKETGLRVGSICADYFMVEPLRAREDLATKLLDWSKELNCPLVEFPFVDSSSFMRMSEGERNETKAVLNRLLVQAEKLGLRLAMETDLPPLPFRDLLNEFPENLMGANLDLGNSASLGYDVRAECQAYGHRIFNVHIKDRVLGGTTVALGRGNVDFPAAFAALKKIPYKGEYILQTAPDADFLGVAEKYLKFTRENS